MAEFSFNSIFHYKKAPAQTIFARQKPALFHQING